MTTETEETAMTATTCTVRFATRTCGKPAVVAFTTAYGEHFAECAEHATGPTGHAARAPEAAPFKVGETVTVEHVGITKTGTVVEVKRTVAMVEVMIGRGTTRRPKVIRRRFAEIKRATF